VEAFGPFSFRSHRGRGSFGGRLGDRRECARSVSDCGACAVDRSPLMNGAVVAAGEGGTSRWLVSRALASSETASRSAHKEKGNRGKDVQTR